MMMNHNSGERTTDVDSRLRQKEQDKLLFHDFLGSKTPTLASSSFPDHRLPPDKASKSAMTHSTASAYSAGGSGGLSSTSDLVERHSGGGDSHLDGKQLFGPRSDVSGSIMSNRFSGSKRSNSDSHFTTQDHPETLHWSKLLRNGPGGHSLNVNPLATQPPRRGQISHLFHQLSSSRFKDENMAPSVIAQTAADEGSRTGIKGPGILSSFTMPNPSKLECFAPSSTGIRKDLTSSTKQMTIFYGGQAHVFDDVRPNKADVIMALAGSSGNSWSTGLSHKPKSKNNTSDGAYKLGQMYEGGSSRETPFLASEFRARPGGYQATSGACHQIFTQPGREHQGSIISRGQDTRDPVHISDPEKEAT